MGDYPSGVRRVGYLDGSFDLFHIGHLRIIQRAAEMCDELIVGVATDELHKAKKGGLPVIEWPQRAAIVRAIKGVHGVIAHKALDETDIKSLGINIRFTGEDYGGFGAQQQKGLAWCKEQGIAIVELPRTVGISTSEIKQRIRSNAR